MQLSPAVLLDTATYSLKRRALRPAEIAHRRARVLDFGPCMRVQFEDSRTLRYQVQEVLWAEGVFDAAGIRDELARYAGLLPNGLDWRASLLIELPRAEQRLRELPALSLAAHRLELQVEGERVAAATNEDLADRHLARPSGVHFVRFALTRAMRRAVRAGERAILHCTHPVYRVSTALPRALLDRLCIDLDASLPLDTRPPLPHAPRLAAA